ncbi:hypothetical protein EVAR_15772_1 [Eumeta japonica]|uniref:Mariner Mos1 transposase n=1 Tax=Eumeta variegata TaxID=151549 RepID=A0A4C1U043_EUMVA|nr:hypothetical protein EVAR_15772_1 [Eumeta japonica]
MTPKQNSNQPYGSIEMKPTEVARERSASKRMIASLFNKTDHVPTVSLENYRTMNSYWYTAICLPEIIDELRKNNHNNASSHTAKHTNKLLKEKNLELMSNPAYIPDLAPCDFFDFQK